MSADATELLEQLLEGNEISEAQAGDLMHLLADGALAPAQAGAVLAALRAKGETADEIRGFANTMRELALPFQCDPKLLAADSVGTGGDASGSFNLSTGTALRWTRCRMVTTEAVPPALGCRMSQSAAQPHRFDPR